MQNYILSMIGVTLLLFVACQKHDVDTMVFEVSAVKKSYRVGDSVTFNFSGNPDIITFFSGEAGKKYEYLKRDTAPGRPVLSFETSSQNGTQLNSLSLLVSNNFSGTYIMDSINKATWTDITARAILSTGVANVKSGDIDLSDFRVADKTYIAFKFTGQQSGASAQRQWTIKNILWNNVLKDGTVFPLFTTSAASWLAVDILNPAVKWAAPTTAQLFIDGGPVNTPDNEDWIISSVVDLKVVKHDLGFAVKDITTRVTSYPYVYKTPGVYKVTFVAANYNVYGNNEVVREFELTINP